MWANIQGAELSWNGVSFLLIRDLLKPWENISNNLSELLITEGDAVHINSWSLLKRIYNRSDERNT